MEPTTPLAVERYLDLGAYVDAQAVRPARSEIEALMAHHKTCYGRVSHCLRAARSLEDNAFNTVVTSSTLQTIERRAKGIVGREIKKGQGGRLRKWFLSAISHQGTLARFDTMQTLAERVYEMEDNFGLAHFMLTPILSAALNAGQDVIAAYSPMQPDGRLEHLLLPGLSLGFVTSSARLPIPFEPYRRIRLDACLPADTVKGYRTRLRFLRKTKNALLDEAVAALGEAKETHDALEALYVPHVDFDAIRQKAGETAAHLLNT